MVKTQDIDCVGYAVKADIYEGSKDGPVLLSLIGRTSNRRKQRYFDFLPRLSRELGITTVIFDYTGHGDSPFDIEDMRQAQQFLEVITVFDWLKAQYPGKRKTFVVGSSYGGFMGANLVLYRQIDGLILRAPAMYRPEDFYKLKKNEDPDATQQFRHDEDRLAAHPLMQNLAKFSGDSLVLVHGRDEVIPTETTDAYAKALRAKMVTADVTHSLDGATPAQIDAYNQIIFDWLQARC
jgi:uncharacterized protein